MSSLNIATEHHLLRVALVGNPNSGKTALFNRLTGSRQKVANYAGVTVERKEGRYTGPSGKPVRVLDLPGTYSLTATSPDEAITREICLGMHAVEAPPDVIVCVADSTNLRLHLRFVLELQRLGRPMVLALNLCDEAARRGIRINCEQLSKELHLPVVETVAVQKNGVSALIDALDRAAPVPRVLPVRLRDDDESLHEEVRRVLAIAVRMPRATAARDDFLDRIVLHPVFGPLLLAAIMFLMFQAVYGWGEPFKTAISDGFDTIAANLSGSMPAGPLRSLIVDGIFAGAGSVLAFLPQIIFLFLFILMLEESGYLPRAAFLLDRFMMGAGLTGRSFIPLLSSFACAVPGIMATRSIQDPRDRFATILVAPLMTCSARLPVYALLIGAFIPKRTVFGWFNLQGLTLFVLYMSGIAGALVLAFALKRWRTQRGEERAEHALLLELPSYRMPNIRDVALGLWERAMIFVRRVGGIILSMTVLLWFLASYPAAPAGATGSAIEYSFAGYLGRLLEVLFAPLGFNWEICIALVPGLAAREVAISSLATVYAVAASGNDASAEKLSPMIAAHWSVATAFSLLAWYVFAPMCLSTMAVIRRETNSVRTMVTSTTILFAMAYVASFITYHVAFMLGAG
jgi:ferrous iron transport protein B